jgi:NCK adaptor protein
MYHQPDLMVSRNGPSLNITAKAKYKYQSNRDDELSLEKGDEVIVMEKEADGWWKGRCGTRIGWFPYNYVEEVPAGDAAPEKAEPSPPREKKFVCGVIALYSFNSGNREELTFQKGDLMDIVDQPADDPDWWEARKANGSTGLIPRNYVEIVHDAEPVFGAEGGASGQQKSPQAMHSHAAHPPPPFAHELWYHGKVARREAESLLNLRAAHGQFIVRSSETKPGDFSISMKAPDRIKHFNVKNLPDGRLGIGQRKFDSMDELIQHYRRAPIYTTTNEGKMYLSEGLPRSVGH